MRTRAPRTRARGIAHTPPLPSFVCVVVLYCRTVPCRLWLWCYHTKHDDWGGVTVRACQCPPGVGVGVRGDGSGVSRALERRGVGKSPCAAAVGRV